MPIFYLTDHQGKGYPYARALQDAGWTCVDKPEAPGIDAAFYDHDVANAGKSFRPTMVNLHERGVPIFFYPHSARPMIIWDGIYPTWPDVRLNVTIAKGHIDVMRAFGYEIPMEACGWAMCEIKPWKATKAEDRPIEVLFGPIHPNRNGFLHPLDRALNGMIYQRLLLTPGIHLTVRHIMRLDLNGLWPERGVKYIVAHPNGSTGEIDAADVVVGHQTFAWLAAARGKPLVMFGDDLPGRSGNSMETYTFVKHYELYRDIMRYPVEAEAARTGEDLRALIDQAMATDIGKTWRKNFIGPQLNAAKFVKTVEKYLERRQ